MVDGEEKEKGMAVDEGMEKGVVDSKGKEKKVVDGKRKEKEKGRKRKGLIVKRRKGK